MVGFHIVQYLSDDEHAAISTIGLRWVIQMPHIWANHGLLTALAERWHSEHNTSHLPTGEALITLEDIYQILRVPCHGEPISLLDR